ncbi:MAG: chemotaxis protein CheW, partial [Kangiellaceae bacterium]|nr:chemotaxis protein CheW [Kangiellaceae bacterium]
MSLSNDIPETKNNNKTGSLEKKSSKWGSSKIHKRESGYLKNISSNINSQNTKIHHLTQLDIETTDQRLKNVERVVSKISLVQSEEHPNIDPLPQKEPLDESSEQATIDRNVSTFYLRKNSPLKQVLGDQFQTLVFDVNQLPLAVPLVKLGGIINISEQDITPLVGTPNWFMGLVPHEGRNLLVVDTQQFLMPEKSTADNREYSFLIVLDDSNWALACHAVGDAKVLTPEQVRWSSRNSKRPWFAGMVLEY